jgi:DNA-binding LacI/PurR family transcriptional regulator
VADRKHGETAAGPGDRRLRATMADVARVAGVSPTTVSFVINDRPGSGIPEDTRARVLAAVAQLDYRPHRAATSLRQQRTHAIGFHVSQSMLARGSLFALSFLPPLIEAADRLGYQVMAFTDHGDAVARIAELVRTNAVDGFVITDSTIDDPRARYLAESGSPFTAYGRLASDLPQCWVDIDNVAAMRLALEHLTAGGHKDIAFVTPNTKGYWWEERLRAYLEWAVERDVDPQGWQVVRAPMEQIGERVSALLSGSRPPSALLTAGDAVVVPCYRAASKLGIEIGKDLAVVGFDPLLWMLDPPLTTLTIPLDDIARAIVERLHGQIDGGAEGKEGTIVPAGLVLRGSA